MKIIKTLLALSLCLFTMSGCEDKKPSVATTVYPVQYLVERIGGSDVSVINISENTMIQRAQIKETYKETLEDSDALFYIGGLEPYMDLYTDDIRSTNVDMIDLATKSAIYKFDRFTTTEVNGQMAGVATPYYDSDLFNGIDIYDNDPMLWMDPVAMTSMASDIKDYLIQKYPVYENIFTENYRLLEIDLARLDADFQKIPNDKLNISFVSMTPSFGIWQKSYGVKVYPITLSKYGSLPSDEQLAVMKERIQKDHVRYIAVEQNLPEDMHALQEKLIKELGLIAINLNNLSSISNSDLKSTKDYISIMYDNLKMLESMAT